MTKLGTIHPLIFILHTYETLGSAPKNRVGQVIINMTIFSGFHAFFLFLKIHSNFVVSLYSNEFEIEWVSSDKHDSVQNMILVLVREMW